MGSFCQLQLGGEHGWGGVGWWELGWGQAGEGGSGEWPWTPLVVQPFCPLCQWLPQGPWGAWRGRDELAPVGVAVTGG